MHSSVSIYLSPLIHHFTGCCSLRFISCVLIKFSSSTNQHRYRNRLTYKYYHINSVHHSIVLICSIYLKITILWSPYNTRVLRSLHYLIRHLDLLHDMCYTHDRIVECLTGLVYCNNLNRSKIS